MTAVSYGIALPASRGMLAPAAKPLLDRLTATPTAAFATWKLRAGYSGSCLRVRRSSDDTEQDIGFSGDRLNTAALLAFCGGGSGYVTKWYDQGASARHKQQTVLSSQPKIVNSGALVADINGLPTLATVAASQQYLTSSPNYDLSALFGSGGVHTAVCLARPSAAGTSNTGGYAQPAAIGGLNGLFYHSYGTSKLIADLAAAAPTGEAAVGSITFPSTHVSVSKSNGATFKAYLDGGGASANTQGSVSLAGVWSRIGWANNPASYFSGGLGAALYFNSDIAMSDLNAIGAELAIKAGVAWTIAT